MEELKMDMFMLCFSMYILFVPDGHGLAGYEAALDAVYPNSQKRMKRIPMSVYHKAHVITKVLVLACMYALFSSASDDPNPFTFYWILLAEVLLFRAGTLSTISKSRGLLFSCYCICCALTSVLVSAFCFHRQWKQMGLLLPELLLTCFLAMNAFLDTHETHVKTL